MADAAEALTNDFLVEQGQTSLPEVATEAPGEPECTNSTSHEELDETATAATDPA